ncbi:putative ribonuclease H-like domain-containing protein [Tanacetum coccineum]
MWHLSLRTPSYEQTSSYSLVANQSCSPQLDHEDLEQLDEFDLEEMDLKWQVTMILMRMKKFYKKTGRKLQFNAKEPVGFDKTKVECYNCHKTWHFARECRTKGNQDNRRRDAWNSRNKDGRRSGKKEDSKALVTIDGEGIDWTSHSEEEDYALMACNSDASIEIKAYTQGLKKVEAQLVAHQQGQLWYKEKIKFMKIDLDDKTDVLLYHKKLLAEAQKEKEDLKAKVEKWHNSSKNLGKLLNTQMSANDKFGLGYGDHRYDGILSYENEVLQSVFMNKESELEKQPLYDRFVTAGGMHASQPSESETQTSDFDTCDSDSSEPTVNEPKVVSQPKVWSDAPIIEEYASDSEDEHVSLPTEKQETPSFANQQVKTPRETVKNQFTNSKNLKVDKKGLGYGFTTKACFVCGSLSHLIRDCDFHEKRMAKQAELNNRMSKKSSQREIRPIWNNVQRVNHKNQFVPTAVLTRTSKILVNTARASGTNNVSTARHNFNSQAVLTNAARKISTVKPVMNRVRPKTVFHKTHSPFSRPFNNTTVLRTNFSYQNTAVENTVNVVGGKRETADYPHRSLKHKGIVDSGCSRHMTRNKAYLAEYQDFNGGPVTFGGSKGYITGKGKIKTGKLDFEDVCFVKELQHFNLFSVSQICDKKNKVLFTDSECLVLSPEFKLPDENQVLLRIPRQNNMYSFNLENIVPSGGLACLIAKATIDESNKWHRRLGHVNFKNLNKLVKGNLVRGLPSKIFQNDHTCVACQKGKQHKASCKAKSVSSISHSLQLLHMDLFGPTSVRSLNHKTYCLVITDDFSRFSWVFFLRTKDETSGILKDFIRQIENQLNQKVKTIRCDNGTEFKNMDFIEFCGSKGIKREYSNARTPQQNGVAERKNNMFLIKAARTMYSLNSKAFRVYNLETKRVEENMHTTFLENKPNVAGKGPNWLFDLDYLTNSMNYQHVRSENQANKTASPKEANHSAGTQDANDARNSEIEVESAQNYFINEEPVDQVDQAFLEELKRLKRQEKEANDAAEALRKEFAQDTKDLLLQEGADRATSTNTDNTASTPVSTDSPSNVFSTVADFTNLESTVNVSPISTSRIHSIHLTTQILGDLKSAVWILVDLPYGKKAIRTKWVYKNKKDERGVVVRNKARIFLAFASYMGFLVYQMDVKSSFLYGKIDEEVYVSQPPGFIDPKFPKKVYKVVKALYGLHQAPKAWYATLSTFLLKGRYRRRTIDMSLFIQKDKIDIMLVQVYVDDIIFGSTKRPDIMFVVCACSRFQVSPKTSHLNVVKRIFRLYSTTGMCQIFLSRRLYFMAMQEADNCGYLYYTRQEYVDAAKFYYGQVILE